MRIYNRNQYMIAEMPECISPEGSEILQKLLGGKITQIGLRLVISMEHVKSLYSAMVRVLVFLFNRLSSYRGELYIVDANDTVLNALRAIGFDKRVKLYSSMFEFEIEHDLLNCHLSNVTGMR